MNFLLCAVGVHGSPEPPILCDSKLGEFNREFKRVSDSDGVEWGSVCE